MIEILDVKDAEPKKLDITPELAIAAYNTLIQFCKQQKIKMTIRSTHSSMDGSRSAI